MTVSWHFWIMQFMPCQIMYSSCSVSSSGTVTQFSSFITSTSIKYLSHSALFSHWLTSHSSPSLITFCCSFFTAFLFSFIALTASAHTDTTQSAVLSCMSSGCCTQKYFDSVQNEKYLWHVISVYDNSSFFSSCWCFCCCLNRWLFWSYCDKSCTVCRCCVIDPLLIQMYWHCTDTHWHSKLSHCNFNSSMSHFTCTEWFNCDESCSKPFSLLTVTWIWLMIWFDKWCSASW